MSMTVRIPDSILKQVRSENDIVDVISEYVQLNRQGKNYVGLCPFHEEKTPSFSVNQTKQLFHCFGCGQGGSIFQFIMEIESLSFVEAVKLLADKSNLQLPTTIQRPDHKPTEHQYLYSTYEWLVRFYHHVLRYSKEGEQALHYLRERGIKEETIETFQLGFAPKNSEATIQFLQQKNFQLPFLVKNGLLNTTDQTNYLDPFRGRVVIPIADHTGKTIAFGGRAFDELTPKYLNSPEHKLFHKSNILYNFPLARRHIRKHNEAIIFEGYLDVITAYQANIKNVVATLGTALTKQQAILLRRTTNKILLSYDGDDAGLEASYEAAKLLQEVGCEVRVTHLPKDLDPDDYIRLYGGDQFKDKIIQASDTFFTFYMRYKRSHYNLSIDSERIAYIEDIVKELANIKSALERQYYIKEIVDEFQISEEAILQEISKTQRQSKIKNKDKARNISNTSTNSVPYKQQMLPAYWNAEQKLIGNMIKHPRIIEKVQESLGTNFNIMEHQVIVTHLYGLYEKNNRINISELVDKVNDEQIKNIITHIMMSHEEQMNEQAIEDYIHIIKGRSTHFSYLQTLEKKQKKEKNPILAAEIGLQIIELKKKLKTM